MRKSMKIKRSKSMKKKKTLKKSLGGMNLQTDHFCHLQNHFCFLNNTSLISNNSTSGILFLLEYNMFDNIYSAILKTSKKNTSDNLLYEFLVGINYINEMTLKFPCFVKTYNIFYNTSKMFYMDMISNTPFHSSYFNIYMKPVDINTVSTKMYCQNPKYFSLLIENIANAMTLHDFINEHIIKSKTESIEIRRYKEMEIVKILFQIYYVLDELSRTFTHYDLHERNVLIEELPEDEYIHMRYRYSNGNIVEFQTHYIARIIDYGKCFFKPNQGMSPYQFFNFKVQNKKDCIKNGIYAGFNHFDFDPEGNGYFISSLNVNRSHDLRLINEMKMTLKNHKTLLFEEIFKMLIYKKRYGTPEYKGSRNERKIYYVSDAAYYLRELIKNNSNVCIFGMNRIVIGTLDIYPLNSTKVMTYTPKPFIPSSSIAHYPHSSMEVRSPVTSSQTNLSSYTMYELEPTSPAEYLRNPALIDHSFYTESMTTSPSPPQPEYPPKAEISESGSEYEYESGSGSEYEYESIPLPPPLPPPPPSYSPGVNIHPLTPIVEGAFEFASGSSPPPPPPLRNSLIFDDKFEYGSEYNDRKRRRRAMTTSSPWNLSLKSKPNVRPSNLNSMSIPLLSRPMSISSNSLSQAFKNDSIE